MREKHFPVTTTRNAIRFQNDENSGSLLSANRYCYYCDRLEKRLASRRVRCEKPPQLCCTNKRNARGVVLYISPTITHLYADLHHADLMYRLCVIVAESNHFSVRSPRVARGKWWSVKVEISRI